MAVNKEALAEMMGEKNIIRTPRKQYPIIRLNGSKGMFLRIDLGKDGYEAPTEIGQIVQGEIIAVRRELGEYTKTFARASNEFDQLTEEITIYERPKDGRFAEVFKGNIQAARDKFQGLRSRYNLYTLINGDIVKIVIRGSGLGNLFEYFNELKESGNHIFEVTTKIQPSQETGDLGVYYSVAFQNAGPVSEERLGEVAVKLQAFHENLKQLKIEAQETVTAEPGEADPAPVEDLPIINLEDDEEIKPEDIPF